MSNHQQQDSGHGGAWIGAVILIGIGVIFLLQNFGVSMPTNWWALFLLVPALAAAISAWRSYEAAGRRFTAGTAGSLVSGIILAAIAVVFLLDLHVNWGLIWPAILIVIGVSALARAYWR